jgi:predicted component of type VI protein secretion system
MEEGGMIPLAMLVLADFAGESDSMSETTPER